MFAGKVRLVVAFCPTLFTSKGAVVDVDPTSGTISVVGTFDWPGSAIEGCVADYSPTVSIPSSGSSVWFNYVSDDGVFSHLDLATATMSKAFTASDIFFTGFETFGQLASASSALTGVSGTATQNGLCNDGCFEYGAIDIDSHKYTKGSLILFKEIADDVYYSDGKYFYIQAGYDLREQKCAPADEDECLLKLDVSSGDLVAATYTDYTIYGIAGVPDQERANSITTFMAGFSSQCPTNNDPSTNPGYAFGSVNLDTANATLSACLDPSVVIDMDEWISSFSADASLWATASGDAYGDPSQLLVVDVASGKPVYSSRLDSLPKTLGAAQNLIWIWAVTWA